MANITQLKLGYVSFGSDYNHTLFFDSKSAQTAYFAIVFGESFNDFTYQKANSTVRLQMIYDEAIKYNYVSYINTDYDDRVFYAFITDYKFVNDNVTEITISTDVIQTWMFDYRLHPSFVEREHTSDDTIGYNTVPENLETGEYVCVNTLKDGKLADCYFIVQSTEFVGSDYDNPDRDKPLATNFGGIIHAGGAYICETIWEVVNIVQALAPVADSIINVYMIPKSIITKGSTITYDGDVSPLTYDVDVPKITALDGYTPKNKKLLTYPYCHIVLSNNNGSSNILKPEKFNQNYSTYKFAVKGCPVVGGSIKCSPKFYNNVDNENEIEGIICGKFPVLSWSSDNYTNWLTQNSVNIGIGLASSGVQLVAGVGTTIATGGAGAAIGGTMAVSGLSGIVSQLGTIYQQSFVPNSAKGNTNGGDINTASKTNTFYFNAMTVKEEYARIIDEFFNMYGYKTNRVKTPNKNHRSSFWFTKTIDCNITGAIPTADLQKIKECYNKGITFWKDASTIYDYSVNNVIV